MHRACGTTMADPTRKITRQVIFRSTESWTRMATARKAQFYLSLHGPTNSGGGQAVLRTNLWTLLNL